MSKNVIKLFWFNAVKQVLYSRSIGYGDVSLLYKAQDFIELM